MMQFISENYFYIVGILLAGIVVVRYLKSKCDEKELKEQ